ncbi:3-hydroxybutyryl-CoA dehydrogenase [Thermoflexales bacterium]|nr:3-hydroxybutyryl-CoA dehydrogenase [Thermoflexales bacterium]
MYIFKAGVVGAGAMGAGIAQVISYSGLPVVLKDVDQAMLDKGLAHIRSIYEGRVEKGKMSAGEMQSKLDLITPTLDYGEFAEVDIVIEAVPEKMGLKQHIFQELDKVCPAGTIYASNTSALSITEMGRATQRPPKVIGMHFFNPAHVMKLVEIIKGEDTDPETVDDLVTFTESLRKIPVVVKECPGFLVNRLLMPYLNEATICLQEGAATAQAIDDAMTAYGWPMGPFTLMDFLGLDVCYDVGEYLYSQYGERMQGAVMFKKLYEAGRYGEKAGAGFYGYGDNTDEPVKAMVAELTGGKQLSGFTPERLMYPLINEAAYAVQENIADVRDIDMAMIAGTGMTVGSNRIGPLALADKLGLDVVVAGLEDFEKTYGLRFHPAEKLYELVKAGQLGEKTRGGFLEYV